MKRSQMVELLLEYDDHLLPLQAEDIIDFLVSQGLQPPDWVKITENSVGRWAERVYCQWEPEDDQH